MPTSPLLSFLSPRASLTVKNNGPSQVTHWTPCLLGQGCGFLGPTCAGVQCSVDPSSNKMDDCVQE